MDREQEYVGVLRRMSWDTLCIDRPVHIVNSEALILRSVIIFRIRTSVPRSYGLLSNGECILVKLAAAALNQSFSIRPCIPFGGLNTQVHDRT